jgi:uncharacterized protein
MKDLKLSLSVLEPKMAICQFNSEAKIPEWTQNNIFLSITKTIDELSIVCPQRLVPNDIKSEKDWKAIKVDGIIDFSLTGVIASLSKPLADKDISIFTISTFNTDYLLVKSDKLIEALELLSKFCEINY